jgi:branched-chain amino acid transport system substrate-binding protein
MNRKAYFPSIWQLFTLSIFYLFGTLSAFAQDLPPEIKIGLAAPLSGSTAIFGQQARHGAELAIERINADGGILGRPVRLVVVDDASDPKQGVLAASRLLIEGVTMVVGHLNSGVSIPASDVYADGGVLQISPATTSPIYTERGLWNTFRICGRNDDQALAASSHIEKNLSGKKIAIIHDRTPYGKGLADELEKALKSKNANLEFVSEALNPGEKDYSALISKLKRASIDFVYYGGLQREAGLLARQMRDQGLNAMMMGPDSMTAEEFISIAGPEAAEGALLTFTRDPRTQKEAAEIVEVFQKRNINPEAYTLYVYAAIQAFKQAAEHTRSINGRTLANLMHRGHIFNTVLGNIRFNEKGDSTTTQYLVYSWRKNKDGHMVYAELP